MSERPGTALSLYVYYRLPAAAREQAQDELTVAHAALQQRWPSVSSQLLEKQSVPGIRDEMLTWMEVHQQPGGLDASTSHAICAMLAPWPSARVGARHVELFATLPARSAL
jgi:hypothetical protein